MGRRHVGDDERAVVPVILARAERVGLHALEVGQYVAVAPRAGVADEAGPVVVVLVLAAQIDHAVDGAGATKNLAARPHGVAPVERGVGFARVHPVEAGVQDRLDLAGGDPDERGVVGTAALEQQDLVFRLGREPMRQHAPGRARTDDDVIPRHSSFPLALQHSLAPSLARRRRVGKAAGPSRAGSNGAQSSRVRRTPSPRGACEHLDGSPDLPYW